MLSLHLVYTFSQLGITLHYTKLYSFRFSCRIVSLTAAKTNLIFSVSVREKTEIQTNIVNQSHLKRYSKNSKKQMVSVFYLIKFFTYLKQTWYASLRPSKEIKISPYKNLCHLPCNTVTHHSLTINHWLASACCQSSASNCCEQLLHRGTPGH